MSAVEIKQYKHKAENILESNEKQFVSKTDKERWNNAQGGNVDLSSYYTKEETDTKISEEVDGLVGAAPDALNTLNELANALGNDENFSTTVTNLIAEKAPKYHVHNEFYTKEESDNKYSLTEHQHSEYLISDRVFADLEVNVASKIFKGSESNIFNYSVKGKTINGKSVGEDEDNKLIIGTEFYSSLITWEQIKEHVKTLGITPEDFRIYFDDSKSYKLYGSFNGVRFKELTQYKSTIYYNGAGTLGGDTCRLCIKYTDGSSSSITLNYTAPTKLRRSIVSDANKTIDYIYLTTGQGMSMFSDEVYLQEVKEATDPLEIKLPHPLRSNADNTICDELINGTLIKRIGDDGNVLPNPIESKLYTQPIKIYDSTELKLLNTVIPTISFKYPLTQLAILNKLDDDVYKLNKDIEQLKNTVPPEIDLSSYYTKEEINNINEKFITGNDLLRTNYNFVSSESSKIIDTAACNIYNYTIKGKTINNESVGESEGNKILISTKTAYIYDYEEILEYVRPQMIPNSYPRLEPDSNNNGKFYIYYRGDGVSVDLVPADFLKENTRYKIIASGFGPFASSNFNVVFTDGTSYSVPLNTVKDIDYISPSNKTISKIYVRLSATGSRMSGCYLANFKCFEYVEDNVPIEIQLDAPLRSNIDNTIFDEITNNKLIRRIASDGSILENPIESKINPVKIKMFNSNTEVILTNTVKPELSFNYPGTTLGILDKHDEDIQAINNKIKESFQYVSSGKELLETTIIDKKGTVSKEGQVPTFKELSNAIKTIESDVVPIITALNNKFDMNLSEDTSVKDIANVIKNIMLDSFKNS